ncbi:MAG TPA: efflux transporter outer membrane subunit [Opitutaceae bacterium]|nr:efflux transporter outer membrane subunit [Opitutaceae bacterium]
MPKSIIGSLLAASLLAGCSLAPHYERPSAPVAAAFPVSDVSKNGIPAPDLAWERFFGDARLQQLIKLTLANNRDLRMAALNVERVRALYNIQRTALIPSLNATGTATRQRTPKDLSRTGEPVTSNVFQIGVEIPSYEVDFFGRVASLRDQVLAEYLATEEARRSAQISLISTVARQYLTLLATEEQLNLSRQTLEAAERSYDLNKQSFDAGVTSELDLRTSEAQRDTYRATVAALQQQHAQSENALVLLVGSPLPGNLPPAGSLATQNLIENLPAGLPSDLLTRRPDIREAEYSLKAANANIGIARAAFFPSVKLTAFGGTASSELSGLFEKGSGAWSFAPSITLPIFAAGRNKANLEVAWIEKRIEIANYEKAIQSAFREVSDALAVRATIDIQIEAEQGRVTAARRRYELSNQRFEKGVDSFLAVLLAQQELFAAEQSLIDARLARLSNLVSLYAALGGGWQEDRPSQS